MKLPLLVALALVTPALLVSAPAVSFGSVARVEAAERPGVGTAEVPDPTMPGATVKEDGIISDGIDIVERLGEQAQIDVPLVDHEGKVVRLRDYMGKRPVILALVYYRCPVLCGLLLSGMAKALQGLDWQAGKEFDVLTVSIDPNEETKLAKEKRRGYLQALGRQGTEGAWPFFTGSVEAIDALAASVGYKFKYIARERQFGHVAALFFLSPEGKITRYLYGVGFDPQEVKLALFESAEGRVGTGFERVLLRCFKFDPSARKYHLFVKNYYRAWGVIIILCLGTFLGIQWRRDYLRSKRPPTPASTTPDATMAASTNPASTNPVAPPPEGTDEPGASMNEPRV